MSKKPYQKPQIVNYGSLQALTLGAIPGCDPDGGSGMTMVSDVNRKENVVPVSW